MGSQGNTGEIQWDKLGIHSLGEHEIFCINNALEPHHYRLERRLRELRAKQLQ
jgi:hypothetical protein